MDTLLLVLALALTSALSLLGVLTLATTRKHLNQVLFLLVGVSTGTLLGDAFIHLLPEAVEMSAGFTLQVSAGVLLGIVFFFVIEKVVHWHHCHTGDCSHQVGTMNLIGDAVHNLIDGLLIASSFAINAGLGITTTIAVALHEIPQELADFGVLLHSGYTVRRAVLLNLASALVAFAGAGLFFAVAGSVEGITAWLVPFTAGGFVYIAGSDLIPELHKQMDAKSAVLQLASILVGIALMAALILVEA